MSAKSLLTVDPSEVQQQCNTTQCLALDLIKANLNVSDRYLTNKVFLSYNFHIYLHVVSLLIAIYLF